MEQQNKLDPVSTELAALTTIVKALQALAPTVRERVINSALTLLGSAVAGSVVSHQAAVIAGAGQEASETLPAAITDIRSLKEQKLPRSATEMAALVAYYLSEVAPQSQRKDRISSADLTKYFKQAGFKLPASAKMTLVHSKNAGYLDALGSGDYQLNPVGYNLVAHNLPGKPASAGPQKKKPRKSPKK